MVLKRFAAATAANAIEAVITIFLTCVLDMVLPSKDLIKSFNNCYKTLFLKGFQVFFFGLSVNVNVNKKT